MASLSLVAFVATYLVVIQKKDSREQEQLAQKPATSNQCSYGSDQEAYGKMVETADEKICDCIKEGELKKTCGSVASDIGFYKKGIADLNADVCGNIKDEITRDACVSVVKGGLEYIQNNKQPGAEKKELTVADYEKIRQEKPTDVNNLLSLAMAYSQESFGVKEGEEIDNEKISKALAVIEEAKKNEPNNAKIYSTEGHILNIGSQNDKALSSYAKSIGLDANNLDAFIGRSKVYSAQEKTNEAIADLERASSLDKEKSNREIYVNLCGLYAKSANKEKTTVACNVVINSNDSEAIKGEAKAMLESVN